MCDDAGAGQAAVVSLGQETLELVTSGERQVVTGKGLGDLKFSPAPSEATKKVFLEESLMLSRSVRVPSPSPPQVTAK